MAVYEYCDQFNNGVLMNCNDYVRILLGNRASDDRHSD